MQGRYIPTDDQTNRDLVKLRRGRLLRASKQKPHSGEPLEADAEDLPTFLSDARREHYDRNDLPSRKMVSAKAALKSLILALYERLSAGVEAIDHVRLSIQPIQSPAATLRPWHPRVHMLHRKGISDWPRGLPFAIQAQFAVGALAFVLLATLILTSLTTPILRPHGLRQPRVASPPLFDTEARLGFSPGLRRWLMAGGSITDKPDLAAQGEQSSPTGPGDHAPNWISMPGLAILSGLPRGARVSNGVLVNEAQWGVPTGGEELTVIALPPSAVQSFRTSLALFNGAGSLSGRVNLLVTHDAPSAPAVDLLSQQQSQQSDPKVVATSAVRPQKHQVKRLQTYKKPPSSILVTGSVAPLLEPAPLPPILSFLGVLAPQPVNPPVSRLITGSKVPPVESAPAPPITAPPDAPIAKSEAWIPATLSDVFKNSY